jgi:uncharacterized protein (DUF1501 family)
LGGAFAFQPWLLNRSLPAAEPGDNKKMLFVFQRGGNDGINTVIPRGDSEYSTQNRPSLFIPEGAALDLGNGFAQLHPAMAPLMPLYHSNALTGVEGPGNLAVIHRVGYANQSRSHFDSMDYWEKGAPRDDSVKDGMFYRHLASTRDLRAVENAFVAASISGSQLEGLKGEHPFPNFRRADEFSFLGDDEESAKFLGEGPGPETPLGKGLRGLYAGEGGLPNSRYSKLVRQTGEAMSTTLGTLKGAVDVGPYVPANGAEYPNGSFGDKLMEAAMLMKRTPVRVIGVNIGGFDTHSRQGQQQGRHANLLQEIAEGFAAFSLDLQDQWEDVIVVTMTEFGRTSKENGGGGTDHAEASAMFVTGGAVKGGVYNCDSTTWKDGDIFSRRGRYLARKTDFRSVFAEIFTQHFGTAPGLLDTIMPGYSEAAEDIPGDFAPLGFV